jgi:hypothetical protein
MQVMLINTATVLTAAIGVTVLCTAISAGAGCRVLVLVPRLFTNAVGHSASQRDYFQLAWLTCSLAMIGASWGCLETEDAVRNAAYVRRLDAQSEQQ